MASNNQLRLQQLAQQLLNQTRINRIRWQPAGSARTNFELTVPSGSVNIRAQEPDGRAPYVLEVYDEDGNLAETLSSAEPPAGQPDIATFLDSPWKGILTDLYTVARDNALDVSPLVDDILRDIS